MKQQRSKIVRVGVDLAKSVIQVHAVDDAGGVIAARQLPRSEFLSWCSQLTPGCIVAMEACCAAHYWSRELSRIGLTPKLIAPYFVTPYRLEGKTGKNDAHDAAAICEAASRPQMRFVAPKTVTQQAFLALHTFRDGLIKERSACMNRTRGVLAEFGIVFPVRTTKFRTLVLDLVEQEENDLPPLGREVLLQCLQHFEELDKRITWCEEQIHAHVLTDRNAGLARTVCGVGEIGASALAASIGDGSQFKNGRQFSAWLGLVPRLSSTGGVQRLGKITKRGDQYLRKLMVLGARSALTSASKRDDDVSKWSLQLRARVGYSKAVVALANKNARIVWRVLSKGLEASS